MAWTSWIAALSGETVSLGCEIQNSSDLLYWFVQFPSQSPTSLLYHHRTSTTATYFNGFGSRFSPSFDSSTQSSQLRITNVSVSDTGNYYCAFRVHGEMRFGTGTMLTVTGSADRKGRRKDGSTCVVTEVNRGYAQLMLNATLSNRRVTGEAAKSQTKRLNMYCNVTLEDGLGVLEMCQCETIETTAANHSAERLNGLDLLMWCLGSVIGLLIITLLCVLIYFTCCRHKGANNLPSNIWTPAPQLTEVGSRPFPRDRRLPREQQLPGDQRLSPEQQLPGDLWLPREQQLSEEQLPRLPDLSPRQALLWHKQLPRTQRMPEETEVLYSALDLIAMDKRRKERLS
ncbi:uncharacterized protein LOC132831418 [Hemiscyllium ocellatum]|uniref:uncharacterized protein LOC132831418 n=1 Tax=Hemiscyllium ocellatum TaxID=170820 RepID=UPI00296653DE|nr:uncharacterized protein LOC132831418 [Hemiscyllium ocellatum]